MIAKKLLIVDDEPNMRHMLRSIIERHGYKVETAGNGEVALEAIGTHRFDFILCDVKMPGVDGLEFLAMGSKQLERTTVIMMSAFGTVDLALEAMKAGAYDFISKPFKSDEVLMTLKKAEEREQLRRENVRLKQQLEEIRVTASFDAMIGESKPMQEVFRLARQIANYDTSILITGASGTGKELVARGIHHYSDYANKEFVAVNCGSIPAHLLESELFGHMRGSFTGAEKDRKGLFEIASGSTLFLDEIGELPEAMQVKLLRVLQEQEVRPIGASSQVKVKVRIIAATARDLGTAIANGSFREDLYYRLNVVNIHIPPLRERNEDVPLLCHHFINKFNNRFHLSMHGISPQALKAMLAYDWPGNVRQLENVIQRAMVLTDKDLIDLQHLPAEVRSGASHEIFDGELSLKTAQKQMEADFIARAMKLFGGNKSRAAEALEISYPSLLKKLKEYRI